MLKISTRGLVSSKDITERQWLKFGEHLKRRHFEIQFAIGDWLNLGEELGFTVDLEGLASVFGWSAKTLTVYRALSRCVAYEDRNEKLSVSHHIAVMGLGRSAQVSWLSKAEKHKWSSNSLKDRVQGRDATPFEVALIVDLPDEETFEKVTHLLSKSGIRWRRVNSRRRHAHG